jgi:hypothetical protein
MKARLLIILEKFCWRLPIDHKLILGFVVRADIK